MTLFKNCFSIISMIMAVVTISVVSCKKETLNESSNVKIETLSSAFSGSDYKIQILLPDKYNANNEYHTVYLLDGDDYFKEVAVIVKAQYSEKVILIGIGYTGKNNRTTDFTYPADDMINQSGGGIQFLKFLTGELVPYVESLGIRSGQKTLLGHSLGGYISLYLTFQREIVNPFNNVIAISPSIFWHDAYLFNTEKNYFNHTKELNINLYMAIGDIEGLTMNTHFNAFAGKVAGREYNNLVFRYETLKNTSHNNSPIIGFQKGLSTIK